MGKTWRIATIFGIPIHLHWTLGLFVLFFIWFAKQEALSTENIALLFGFVIALFCCILLHEFGHSLTAKRFGVKTRDIILSPIGGLARLESIPNDPWKEFKIAINGPLVNLLIAIILVVFILLFGYPILPDINNGVVSIGSSNFLQMLMYTNIGVFMFNLIPAFPMDGGRILRSLLSLKLGRVSATKWASILGKLLAICFTLYAVFHGHLLLIIIGPFIYFLAGQEYRQVLLSDKMKTTILSEIMVTKFTKVYNDEPINSLLESVELTDEKNFLVYDHEDQICGSLPELFLEEIKNNPSSYTSVNEISSPNFLYVESKQSVDKVFQIMKEKGLAIVAVVEKEIVVGVVDRTTISRFIFENTKRGIL